MKTKTRPSQNPYLNARRTWNSHTSGLLKSLHLWQLIGFLSLLITLTTVAGLIHLGGQSKFIPLVFREDASGNVLSVTKADRVKEASLADYRSQAAHFIENIRLVSADVQLQRKAIFQLYSALNQNDPALTKVQEFYQSKARQNPFERAATELVSIEIRSVLQETDNSWQVDWLETVRLRDGTLKEKPVAMKAKLSLYQDATIQVDNSALLNNPHFVSVRLNTGLYRLRNWVKGA